MTAPLLDLTPAQFDRLRELVSAACADAIAAEANLATAVAELRAERRRNAKARSVLEGGSAAMG